MKTFLKSLMAATGLLLVVLFSACEKETILTDNLDANSLVYANSRAVVIPVLYENWQSGDAYDECTQAGSCGTFAYKVDGWDATSGMDGDYTHAGNTITIYNSDGQSFSWTSSDYEVCAVIVKAGPDAYVYSYPEGSCGDTEMLPPTNPANGQLYDISHVSFCWTETPCDTDDETCYEEETGWVKGKRYVQQGNWAMYTRYAGYPITKPIIGGKTMVAGSAYLAPSATPGMVDITLTLAPGWIFYYDGNDPMEDENVKVQDYATPPSGNPAPGQFDYKESAPVGGTYYVITVPLNNFYGIHLDLAREVPCEE